MPSFDRVVRIGAPNAATYTGSHAALESDLHAFATGDSPSRIDVPGEFAFATAAGLIAWWRDRSPTHLVSRDHFAAAVKLLAVPPQSPGTLPHGDQLTGGKIALGVRLEAARAIRLFDFDITAGTLADGRLEYAIANYQWRYSQNQWEIPTTGGILDYTADQVEFVVNLDFAVRTAAVWAMLLETAAVDSIGADAVTTATQRRQYRIRHTAEATTFKELTDDDGTWNIVAVEPEGRKRFMMLDCERTVTDLQRRVLIDG